ncbi:hypothetical protein I4U23_004496 [Adineta vaga]|nr:hypothetical protein I4U23_004496 [Adineta vaga]
MNLLFCKIRSFIYTWAIFTVAYSFLNMAISCYFITIFSKHRCLLSIHIHWLIIILSWILSGIIITGTSTSPYAYIYEPESGLCILTTKYFLTSIIVTIVVFIIPLNTIIILYGWILLHISQQKKMHPNNQIFKRIFVYITILFISGSPYFFSTILYAFGYQSPILTVMIQLFIALGCAVNSIAILFTNHQVKDILRIKLGYRPNSPKRHINQNLFINHNRIQTIKILPIIA